MVNLDNVRTGDTLVIEVPLRIHKGKVVLNYADIFLAPPGPNDRVKILEHKAVGEPTGLGAVVKIKGKTTGIERTIVKVSGYSWAFSTTPNTIPWSWDDVIQVYRVVEVISEGVEL